MERYIRKIVYFERLEAELFKGNRVPHYKYEERKGKVRIAFTIDSMYIKWSGKYTLFLIVEKDKINYFREMGYFLGGMKGQIDRLFDIILEEGEFVKGVFISYGTKPLFVGYQEERIQIDSIQVEVQENKVQKVESQEAEDQEAEGQEAESQEEESQEEEISVEGMHQLFEKSKKLFPFDKKDEEIEWISIRKYDLGLLPEALKIYKDNAFLINCEQIYKHLIFGRDPLRNSFLLGIPDVYNATEKMLGNIFGFHDFFPCKGENPIEGTYGYWVIKEVL